MNETQTQIKWNLTFGTTLEAPTTLEEELEAWLESEVVSEPLPQVAPEDFEKLYGWFYS